METTAGVDVEMIIDSPSVVSIPQKKGKITPYPHTAPKKQKRTTSIDSNPTDEDLDEQIESISRIRNAVKYVKSSASKFASFKSYVEKAKLDTHGLLSLEVEPSEDLILIDMAGRMEVKFDKY
ncbi:hypothetical protein KY284_005322 [Solanum tuberosum]|nr:hypothetical protein KY284_005322 [Solanum tuberosum]